MAPLFNTTAVCNTTENCAHALDVAQLRLDDFQRLSYILASLFGIVLLLFICSPLILNLPKERPDSTRSAPSSQENKGLQMRDLERRGDPQPQFVIGDEDDDPAHTIQGSKSTLPDPSRFREVKVDGETFHVARSAEDVARLQETRVFRGAGDERELAQRCVDEARPTSSSSSPVLPSGSHSAGNEQTRRDSTGSRIGTAVSM